jgi:cytochrome c biogenesis protein CcdA
MSLNKELYKFQDFWFNIFIVTTYSLYILFAVGIFKSAPQYLETLDYYVKIYISLFLLWRFNPFRTINFTELDRKISFSAGVFLFTTSAINQILVKYLNSAKNVFQQNSHFTFKLGLP